MILLAVGYSTPSSLSVFFAAFAKVGWCGSMAAMVATSMIDFIVKC